MISTVISTTAGLIAGYSGRFVDTATMGFVGFMLVLPFIPFLLVLGGIFPFTPLTIALVLSV